MVTDATTAEPVVREGPRIDLEQVEGAVRELLRSYRTALQYASDMPVLGRSAVTEGHARWGSRFLTRVYAETHVRRQLSAVGGSLRLERVGSEDPEAVDRIAALEQSLEGAAEPLFRWRRLVALVARLPPIAAAVPILAAAAAGPFAADVSADTVRSTLLWLAVIALGLWILVVWPSIRLGFRVKRAIFAGGDDLRHVWWNVPGKAHWEGFRAPAFYDTPERRGERKPVPEINVYKAENDVFRALGRRKPAEVPLDLILGPTPYSWFTGCVLIGYGVIHALVRGAELSGQDWVALVIVSSWVIAGVIILPRQGARNYRTRRH